MIITSQPVFPQPCGGGGEDGKEERVEKEELMYLTVLCQRSAVIEERIINK